MTVAHTVRVPGRATRRDLPFVATTAAVVVLLRLLLVARPATPDEGGFLVVASQWHVGGSSLYGNYWVDRPPLLLGIFRLADLAGGLIALRVFGALAAATTVVLLTAAARRAFDGPGSRTATRWTGVVAAALLVSPLLGSDVVDGELLALPFVALGLRLAVEVVRTDDPLAARGAALGAGAAAVLALLVKQNLADVVVFALACWLVAWRSGRLSGRTLRDLLALAGVGAAVGYAVVMLWAMAHGTSPLGVYEATYPFRIHAGRLLVEGASRATHLRIGRLETSAVLSGAALLLIAFVAFCLRRDRRDPVIWALAAAAVFALASIAGGGSYWRHYLVESIPVVALSAGALSAAAPRLTRVLVSLTATSALVAVVTVVVAPEADPGAVVGRALEQSAHPGDTVLSAFGDADVLEQTGMSSPYPYLWSLPSRALDPDLTLLRGVLAGPEAPTWIVVRDERTFARLGAHGVRRMVDSRYRPVGTVCGRTIYLLRGVSRPAPASGGRCGGTELP